MPARARRSTSATRSASTTAALVAAAFVIAAAASVYAATRPPSFSLSAQQKKLGATPGASATFAIRIKRTHGFRGQVGLLVTRLPKGATATWSTGGRRLAQRGRRGGRLSLLPARAPGAFLTVRLAASTQPANYTPVVKAFARRIKRQLRLTLVVRGLAGESGLFQISGDAPTALRPGLRAPLDLTLTNPYSFPLSLTSLSVTVRPDPSAQCDPVANYVGIPYSGPLPLTLPAGRRALHELVPDGSVWPAVAMLDLPVDQAACRGVRIGLDYTGTAVR